MIYLNFNLLSNFILRITYVIMVLDLVPILLVCHYMVKLLRYFVIRGDDVSGMEYQPSRKRSCMDG